MVLMNIKIRFTVILFFLFFPLITEAEEVAKNQDTIVVRNDMPLQQMSESGFGYRGDFGALSVVMNPVLFKDMNFMFSPGYSLNQFIDLRGVFWSLHFIKDGGTYRFSPNVFLAGIALASGFTGEPSQYKKVLLYFWTSFFFVLNPSVDFFLWQKYVPISIGAGYNTDWFLFSPGRELYFKPHIDLNVMFKLGIWFKLTGSFAYLVTDTYDLKHGPRFEFRIGI